jgi:hypothetical protein
MVLNCSIITHLSYTLQYMVPLFFSLGNRLELMVIPDSDAHVNGQTILINTYSIFLDVAKGDPQQSKNKESSLHLERVKDPDYFGYLTLKKPGSGFTYTEDGRKHLSTDELEQLVEQIKE